MLLLRRWWPVPAAIAVTLFVQKVFFESRYDVSGHAGEHLSSASAPFAAAAFVAILLVFTPRARTHPLVLVPAAGWLIATAALLVGNVRVIDVLVRAGMSRTPTSEVRFNAALDAAHSLADAAPWYAVLAVLALIAALWRLGHISLRVAIGASMLNVIFPPWIFPGAGILVLLVARGIAYHRSFAPLV